jgi:hypothetical protein
VKKALCVCILTLAAIIFSAQASPAASIVFTNKTDRCVWTTFYWKHAWGWDIMRSEWTTPGKDVLWGHLCNGCRIKVRAEVMASSACSGHRIADLEYITDENNDPLNLIRRPDGGFQIKRHG